jgi:hypothetical protein
MWVGQSGIKHKKVYMLPPSVAPPHQNLSKNVLWEIRRKTLDPVVVYCDYYLLLETTYNLYTYYEKEILSQKLEEKDQQIEEKNHKLKKR